MTINSTTRKAGPFVGNGTVSAFPFGFKVFQASDLFVVRLNVSAAVEQTLVLNSDYSVTLNPDQNSNPGGVVTLSSALASGYTLTLTSDVPDTQPTDLTNQGGFYPEVINDALDRATIQIQQLQEEIDRTITAPISTPAGTDLTFPLPEANQFIGWNSTATGLQNLDGSTLASIVAFATAYADTFNGDGATSTFALSYPPATVRNLDVSINGVTQVPVVDYNINGQALNFTTPPPLGSIVLAKYWQALPNSSGAAQDFTLTPSGYTTAVDVQEGFDDLGSSAGTSKVGFLQAGTGAQARSAQDKLRDVVSVKDFGAVGDGVTDDTAAIQAAIDATPIGGFLTFPDAGNYKVTASASGALAIANSITIDFQGSKLICDTNDTSAHVIKIATTVNTQPDSLGPFNVFSFVNLKNGYIQPTTPVDQDFYNAASDPRTASYNGIYMEAVDSVKMDNMFFDSIKGAALYFGDGSAVRESYFNECAMIGCGDASTQRAALLMVAPVSGAPQGIHNHLYFNGLRVNNSYWRSVDIARGATTAATFGAFIIEFNSCQFDNALETAAGSGIPAGPQCEMTKVECTGWHVSFTNCIWLNPYSAATTDWGYPCVRLGTSNYTTSTAESTEFINCRFQQGLNWGVGVHIERANKVRFTQPSFAFQATNEQRTIVVAKISYTNAYGVAADNDVQPYIWFDNTIDMNSGVFYAVASRVNGTFGALVGTDSNLRSFAPNGFYSGSGNDTVPPSTTQTININLDDYSFVSASGVSYIVTATLGNTGAVNLGSVSAIITCVDSNIVSDVLQTGQAMSNPGTLDATLGTYGGLAAGTISAGNGNKVALDVTNNDAALDALINWSIVRLGSIFA